MALLVEATFTYLLLSPVGLNNEDEASITRLLGLVRELPGSPAPPAQQLAQLQASLPDAARLAVLLKAVWLLPERQAEQQLIQAQAAATRSCAYLRCANVGAEGGPAAGQGLGSMRCR